MVRAAQLQLVEVHLKARLQFLAIPVIHLEELLVVLALFVPVGKQGGGEVHPFAVKAGGDHVDMRANLFDVGFLGFERVGHVPVAGGAVHHGVYPHALAIAGHGNVDRERHFGGVADGADLVLLPFALVILHVDIGLGGQRRSGDGPVGAIGERPAGFQRRTGSVEDLDRLHGFVVPHNRSVAELLHGVRVFHDLAEIGHVVVPAGEGGGEHDAFLRVDGGIVAIAVAAAGGRHHGGADIFAGIVVDGHAGLSAMVLGVGQGSDDHAARQGVEGVGANQAGLGDVVIDGLDQLGLGGVGAHVEDKDFVAVQRSGPHVAPVVGEAHVVGFAAPADGEGVDDLAVGFGAGVGIHGDQLVG